MSKLRHDVVSPDHACRVRGCKRHIKQRLVNIKGTVPKLCYEHWMELKRAHKYGR